MMPEPESAIEMLSHFVGKGVAEIAHERHRQATAEGFSLEHDDEHTEHQLALAAISYAWPHIWQPEDVKGGEEAPTTWPWALEEWKPGPDYRRDLVKAGALIAAEIDRLDRVEDAPDADTSERAKVFDEGINAEEEDKWPES